MNAKEILLALCLGLAAASVRAKDDASSLVYIGTRGTPQTSTGPQGIYAARLDTATGKLTPLGQQLELSRISWLLAHPSRHGGVADLQLLAGQGHRQAAANQ
jgi:hypothetical protein